MPWSLEIHHIDVGQGDATLFIARGVAPLHNVPPAAIPPGGIVRSVLIDGGLGPQGPSVHAYIVGPAGLAHLDVMVATHYDGDHVRGLTHLLTNYPGTYDNTIIFDQGWALGCIENAYTRAINGLLAGGGGAPALAGAALARSRPTNHVINDLGPGVLGGAILAIGPPATPPPGGMIGGPAGPPQWLAGKEIMWTDGNGYPAPTLYGPPPAVAPLPPPVPAPVGPLPWPAWAGVPAPGAPGGPPAITCIAANQFILQPGGGVVQIVSGLHVPCSNRGKNEKSLVFLVTFNRFRYYIGGDIETAQEEDPVGGVGIMNYLNPMNIPAGRIHAIKTSHHGSGFSTSVNFINRVRPTVAFVSCGVNNGFGMNPVGVVIPPAGIWPLGHPQQSVLEDLNNFVNFDNAYLTNDRHNDDFCGRINAAPPPNPGGGYYAPSVITCGGWGLPVPAWGAAPPAPSPCAGAWPHDGAIAPIDGNIILRVTEVQANHAGGGVLGGMAGQAQFNVIYDHPPFGPPGGPVIHWSTNLH